MPLFVVKNKINELDVDAIVIPYCKDMDSYISELANAIGGEKKEDFNKQFQDSHEDSISLLPGFGLKAKNIIVSKFDSILLKNPENSGFTQTILTKIYQNILDYAYSKELDYIAIPVISLDVHNSMYLSIAVKVARQFVYNSSRDVTIYLVNNDKYALYRCFKEDWLDDCCWSLNRAARDYIAESASPQRDSDNRFANKFDEFYEKKELENTRVIEAKAFCFSGFGGFNIGPKSESKQEPKPEPKQESKPEPKQDPKKRKSFSLNSFMDLVKEKIGIRDESFSGMVMRIIEERKLDHIKLYRAANVDKDIFSKIKKDACGDLDKDGNPFVYKPKKNIVMSFIIALKLNLFEAEEMLRKAGYAKVNNSLFDKITFLAIENGFYDLDDINEVLLKYDQPRLGSVVRDDKI